MSARYVAVKPFRVERPSDTSSTNIEPVDEVIGGGSSAPVSEASIGPFESSPVNTFT